MNQAFETVSHFVAQFKEHESAYLASSYHESQVRQDFIDRFFAALGWDVTHDRQKNPYEQEVHIENKVHVGASQRRADYAFFLHPNYRDPKFFVEAKKPSRNLANPDDYYQTVRYGWNAGTPIAVLTDFEEFHILDCRFKPSIADSLSHKIESFRYADYTNEETFSRIYWLFSREAVAGGSLEKRAAELSKPRGKAAQRGVVKGGYQPVDEAFLGLLDEYRKSLASAFKKADHSLDGEQLTEAVQRTLDRIVFIRFLEDKQIEEPRIVALRTKPSAWKAFQSECRTLDSRYNGLIFKPHPILDAKEFALPDEEPFVRICDELSDPSSPYNFDQIPISILGSIYERFLGKVIRLQGRGISVEEKPEVRKAGGVYYTPQYIVRHIVNETVGKLLYGTPSASTQNVESTPHSRGGESSAAGSVAATGLAASFLAGGRGKGQSPTSTTSATRKTPEEVAKMSFADIACGSGSFLIEVYAQLLEYHLRYYAANPAKRTDEDVFEREGKLHLTLKKKKEILANNVYGVDIDFQATEVTQLSLYLKLLEDVTMHDAHQFGMFKETILPDLRGNIVCGNSLIGTDIKGLGVTEEFDHLKPMDFECVFPNIFKKGGPSTSSGQGFDAVVGNPPYLKITGNNVPRIVLEYYENRFKSIHGGSSKNLFQLFIEKVLELTPDSFSYIVPEALLTTGSNGLLRKMMTDTMSLRSLAVFDNFVFQEATIGSTIFVLERKKSAGEAEVLNLNPDGSVRRVKTIAYATNDDVWDTASSSENELVFNKISSVSVEMRTVVELSKGMVVQDRKKHLRPKPKKDDMPFVLGSSMARYELNYEHYTNYSELTIIGGTKLLQRHTVVPRLLIRRTGSILCATYSANLELVESTAYILTSASIQLKYLLGVLNSKLLTFYLQQKLLTNVQGFPQVLMGQLEQLPIRTINFSDPTDKARHDHIVGLVEQMLAAKEKVQHAKTDAEKSRLELQCESLDRQIDDAVYDLYGLTEEERRIVEDSTRRVEGKE